MMERDMTMLENLGAQLAIALLNSLAWALMVTAFAGPIPPGMAVAGVAGSTGLCLLLFAVLGASEA